MKKISRTTSSRGSLFPLFRLFTRFTNHRMAGSGRGMEAFRPSRCLSPLLRRLGWCSQLVQKGGHRPSHLRQGQLRTTRFPRSVQSLDQRTRQDQQIVRTGNHPCPAFSALRGREPWDVPKQLLLVKAIAMLVRVAQAIRRADLSQRSRFVRLPQNG